MARVRVLQQGRGLGFAIVKVGTSIQIKPLHDESTDEPVEPFGLHQDSRLRVMTDNEDSEWVDVGIPRYGHCLVARESSVDHIKYQTRSRLSRLATAAPSRRW